MDLSYDQLAADYAVHRSVQPILLRRLAEFCHNAPPARVLEIGCGTGNYATALAAMTKVRCSGLDPSSKMLDVARQKTASVAWLKGSAECLPFPDGTFDLVYSVDVIHHVQDRPAFFREAFRALAGGGWCVTATDSEETIRKRVPLSRCFPETIGPELARYPQAGEIPRLLSAAGFRGMSEEVSEFPYDLSDASAFQRKAFSCLRLISEDAFNRGLERLQRELAAGPLRCVSRNLVYVAWKPSTA
jgi:ubiquinone/menaquinone biosynthesis C-methylase UbiE